MVLLNLDFHYSTQNSQPLIHILIKINPFITLPFRFKIPSNMILLSTSRSSNFSFIMLLFTPSRTIPWISHYNDRSHLFTLHTCCGVLSALQNKYSVILKVSMNMFSLYVRILRKCFVCCCCQYSIHSFFCSAVSNCVLDNFNNISLSLSSKIV
jgi:hypothetical protein